MRRFFQVIAFRVRWIIAWFNIRINSNERQRKIWAKIGLKSLRGKFREGQRVSLGKKLIPAKEHGEPDSDRPYKGCMTQEHFDVIRRNRVLTRHLEGRIVFEINTKDLAEWELEEFRALLKEEMRFQCPPPILREVLSDKFPQ